MHHCDKCGHNWTARVENPQVCPRCKRYLNAPKKEKKEPEVINV